MGNVRTIAVPSYYKRLANYFPTHEMKNFRQLQALVEDVPYYDLMETSEYLVLYGDFSDFMFIDYLLVNRDQRGAGIGSRLMERLKARNKPILLEVEPTNANDPDTYKRRRFYAHNGFTVARGVQYERFDDDGQPFQMDLLYWSPSQQINDEQVMTMMTEVCKRIHNYKAESYYGRIPADPDEVLSLAE
ncbi:GNAT family N-acetyltransferase [Alicyclobacillus dauci]|uniref:GNAT family N-acetyltransferase n=1 Tax=Alicyclobacillus dauci TaxID=1475485 RepID=A0ABY6Z8R2_9BACL|nr:GNAT family N-acetyltransferase [Alicyclobacillus dauci]WAH38450.1 GNAT family N-acetyltransferase [Alicyclobacillus dauci]